MGGILNILKYLLMFFNFVIFVSIETKTKMLKHELILVNLRLLESLSLVLQSGFLWMLPSLQNCSPRYVLVTVGSLLAASLKFKYISHSRLKTSLAQRPRLTSLDWNSTSTPPCSMLSSSSLASSSSSHSLVAAELGRKTSVFLEYISSLFWSSL